MTSTGPRWLSRAEDEAPDDVAHLDAVAARLGVGSRRRPTRVTIPTPEGELSALDWLEPGETPEVLFVHGGGLNAHAWDTTIMLLDRPARAIDLPGHGWSAWREDGDYRPPVLAAAVAAAAPQDRPVLLVGHSLGGLTSLMALRAVAPRPSAFVLVDITPVTIASGRRPPRGVHEPELSFATREEAVEWAVEHGLGRNRETLAIGIGFNTRRRADGRYAFRHHLAHLPPTPERFDHDPAPYWGAFDESVSTTLVHASRGVVDEAQVAAVLEHAPWVRVERVESGHNVHSQAPEALVRIIRALAG